MPLTTAAPAFQAVHPGLDVGRGMNAILKDDLACRVIEAHRGHPAAAMPFLPA